MLDKKIEKLETEGVSIQSGIEVILDKYCYKEGEGGVELAVHFYPEGQRDKELLTATFDTCFPVEMIPDDRDITISLQEAFTHECGKRGDALLLYISKGAKAPILFRG